MFLIAGTKGVTSTVANGIFYCLNCSEKTEFLHKQVHQTATAFFISVAKLKLLGEYIECQKCQCTFELGVLDYDPEEEQREFYAEYHRAIKRVLTMMMLADGKVDENELKLVKRTYSSIISEKYSEDEINKEIQECKNNPESLNEYLSSIGHKLSESGKEMIIKVAYWVSLADDEYAESEQRLLKQISKALDISSAHLNGIINEIDQEMEELEKQENI